MRLTPNKETLWGMIEEQLTGKIDKLSGNVSHGGEALRQVLETQNQPVLILIDELLHYVNRADGIKVEQSTLAQQTIGFVQELSEAVSGLKQVCVVVTLPSSANEQLGDARYTELYEQLQNLQEELKILSLQFQITIYRESFDKDYFHQQIQKYEIEQKRS